MRRLRRTFAATALVASVALGTTGVAAAADQGPLASALDSAAAQVGALAQPVVTPVVEPIADTVSQVVAPVAAAVAPVVEPVVKAVEPVVEPVAEAVAPVIETVEEVAAPVVEPVLEVVAPVVELVDETVAPVLDVVEPVAPPVTEVPTGGGSSQRATTSAPYPAAGVSPPSRTPPGEVATPIHPGTGTHTSVEVPASIMATAIAQAVEDLRPHSAPTIVDRGAASHPLTVVPPSASPFSAQPEPPATPSAFERVTGSLSSLADRVATVVSSSGTWAAASISVGVAAALTLVALLVFPGFCLRLRAVSDRSPPFRTVSLLERPA